MSAASMGIVSGSRSIGAADLDGRVRRIAAGFAALGVGPGQCVAILMRNDIAFIEAAYAAQTLGAYAVPINWHFKAEEIGYILADCGTRVLVAHADLLEPIAAALPPEIVSIAVSTPPEVATAYGFAPVPASAVARAHEYEAWLAAQVPYAGEMLTPSLTMFYTSGTTGHPKGVRRPAPEPAADGRDRTPAPRRVRHRAGYPLRRAGAALPLRTQCLCHARRPRRRRDGADAALRSGRTAGADRARAPRHHVHGADHVHPPVEAARGGAAPLRRLLAQVRHPRGGALPARGQAGDDRVVGAGDQRVLRLDRIERRDVGLERRHAGQARYGGQGGRRRRAAHPRRRWADIARRRDRRDLHALRRAARLHLSQPARPSAPRSTAMDSSPRAISAISTRTAISSCATASATW